MSDHIHIERYTQHKAGTPKSIALTNIPYIITVDAHDKVVVLQNKSILVQSGKIKAIVPAKTSPHWLKTVAATYDAGLRSGVVITPGFVNAHAHPPMYLLRSTTLLRNQHATTEESLQIARRIEQALTIEDQTIAALGDFTEQQKFGTTTVLSHYHTPQATRPAAVQAGLRLVDAVSVASKTDPKASLKNAAKTVVSHHPLITTGITIHTLGSTSMAELRAVRKFMQRHPKLLLTIHCAESMAEVDQVVQRHHQRPVAVLQAAGLLGPRLVLSHAVHFTNEEIEVLAKYKVGIVHLPTSNLFHKSGQFRYSDYVVAGAGAHIALGTDSVISKSRLDLVSEAYQSKLQHETSRYPASLADLFKMITVNGARVFGLEKIIGRVAVGLAADLAFWKLKDRMFVPFDAKHPETLLGNFMTHAGYTARDVMINGRFVIQKRQHMLVNESELLTQLQEHHTALLKRV